MPIQYQTETFNLVSDRLDAAQDYASTAWELVTSFIGQLQDPTLYTPNFSDLQAEAPEDISNTFSYDEQPFQSDLVDALNAAIEDLIENGGTGLDADVEDAIWERARARKAITNERVYQEALEFWSARGWTIPPGALGGRLTEALAIQTQEDSQINYEIMIEQARLAQKNTEFAMSTGADVVKSLYDFADKVRQRGLDEAKAAVTAAVQIFKAQGEKFRYRVELLIAEANNNMKMAIEANSLRLETLKAGANVAAQLTASALSGTSVGAQIQYEGGYRYNNNESTEQRESTSYSEEHIYQEK
jgi:hypothetical protein